MKRLKKALKLNAIFSGISGLVLILFYTTIAQIFGVENNSVFWIVGILLIFFSLTIVYEIKEQRRIAVWWIIIQDFLWAVGSLILILFNPFNISLTGNIVIIAVALLVLYMGVNQMKALIRA